MDLSKFLSKVMGIYLVVISIAFLMNMKDMMAIVQNIINNGPLMFVAGCITVILGAMLIVSHNIWRLNWRVLITILGWVFFLKGICIILYPYYIDKISLLFIQNSHFAYASVCIDFVLGIALIYFGFKGKMVNHD